MWLVCALSMVGCTPFQSRVPNFSVRPARLVILPVMAMSMTVGFSDRITPDPARAKIIRSRADGELGLWAKRRGAFMLPADKIESCSEDCQGLFYRYVDWMVSSSMEIAGQQSGRFRYGRDSVNEWRATHDYSPVQAALGADEVLVVVVRDLRQTPGRKAGKLFLGIATAFKQVIVACIATLGSSVSMQWCQSDVDHWPDLTEGFTTQSALLHVLSELGGTAGGAPHPTPSPSSSDLNDP